MVKKSGSEQWEVMFFRSQVVQYSFGVESVLAKLTLKIQTNLAAQAVTQKMVSMSSVPDHIFSIIMDTFTDDLRNQVPVCRLSFVYVLLLDFASILRLLVAVGFNGHWWCSYATSDQCNWYDLASVVSPTKRCTYTFVQWCCFHMVFYLLNKAKMLEFTATETKRSH